MNGRTCTIDSCTQPARARGWCSKHWQRWRRHGNPETLLGRDNIVRRDAAAHGTRRSYQLGCHCFACRIAQSRYRHRWEQTGPVRVPAHRITAHLETLIASGWTKTEIAREADLGNSTIWHITAGKVRSVNSRTAAAILSLQPFGQPDLRLDPAPLLRHLQVARRAGRVRLNPADRKAIERAGRDGWITEPVADRIAVRALGLTIDEIYGLDIEAAS